MIEGDGSSPAIVVAPVDSLGNHLCLAAAAAAATNVAHNSNAAF